MNHEVVDSNDDLVVVYTLDDALSSVGFGKYQYLVLAYAGLGAMAEAMEVMILSFIGPAVKSQWQISSSQESFITTVVFAGMLIGNYFWSLLSDNYGRRREFNNFPSLLLNRTMLVKRVFRFVLTSIGLLSVAVVTSLFSLLSAFSPNYTALIIFRVVVGIGLGGGPVYSAWFLEFVPVENRGVWMVLFSTFWTIGTILEAALAWIVMPTLGWRWLLFLSSVPCLAALVLYFLIVESPRYLYMNDRIDEAQNILTKMSAINQKDLPSGMLISDQITDQEDEEFSSSENSLLLSSKKDKTKPGFSSLFMLLSSRLVKTTLLMWVVYFGNSFFYYGVVLLTSESSSGQNKCGSNALHSTLTDSSLYRNTLITSFAEVPGLILSALLVDKVGRKISMVLMYSFGFVFLLPLIFYQNEVFTTSLLFGARVCAIGTFTVAGVYCPEIYPTSVRTTGVGVATAMGRIAGMICPLVAVELVSGCHQMAAVSLFEVIIILSTISACLFPIETKGRVLNDTSTSVDK